MDKLIFTSEQLPPGLTDRERFKAWCDLYNEKIGARGDLEPSEARFDAHLAFVRVDDVVLGRADVTVERTDHGGRHRATAADEERMGLVTNTSGHPIHVVQRGHEEVLAPGGSVLLSRADQGRFTMGRARSSWAVIDMPRLVVTRAAPGAEDLVGKPLVTGGEALRMVSGYVGLIFREGGFADPHLDAHVAQTLLDLVGLAAGAEGEARELARDRGLRAARTDAIVQALASGYADPSFSVAIVARKLQLSQRYVQDLLQATGVGFAERVMELRLQHSLALLARAHISRRKVSDIALSSGFNDLSYFHRCFRRRFGMTPAGARAG